MGITYTNLDWCNGFIQNLRNITQMKAHVCVKNSKEFVYVFYRVSSFNVIIQSFFFLLCHNYEYKGSAHIPNNEILV